MNHGSNFPGFGAEILDVNVRLHGSRIATVTKMMAMQFG
jgi:hypothetical protein